MLAIGAESMAAQSPRERRLRVLKLIAIGYVVAIAGAVLIKFLGTGALALLGLMLATSPSAIGLYGTWLPWRARRAPETAVSTEQLCRQWLDSYAALSRACTSQARLRVVIARQHCLDELERRDPDGLQAWLASSAGAGTDPRRFLTDRG